MLHSSTRTHFCAVHLRLCCRPLVCLRLQASREPSAQEPAHTPILYGVSGQGLGYPNSKSQRLCGKVRLVHTRTHRDTHTHTPKQNTNNSNYCHYYSNSLNSNGNNSLSASDHTVARACDFRLMVHILKPKFSSLSPRALLLGFRH